MFETTLFVFALLLSAFFSGSETAYISANRLKLRLAYRNAEKFGATNMLLSSDQRFLTTTLVGNNVVNVACSSLAVIAFSGFLSEAVTVLFTSTLVLLFGEITPKSIAAQMPNRLLRPAIHVLQLFYFAFYPLIWLAEKLSHRLITLFDRHAEKAKIFSKFDLLVLVREYSSRTDFAVQNQKLLSRALRFREKKLWDIMIPRTEIYGVEESDSLAEISDLFKKSGYSRLPVYRNNLDNIIGFLYVLDFFAHDFKKLPEMRPPLILPESMKVIEALQRLQREKTSIAITVDEHGGTAGIVTMEDIVEKLVGAIDDEFDFGDQSVKSSGDETFIVEGRASVDELREHFDLNIPEGDYVTIAGLVEDVLGRIPEPGEVVDFPKFKIKVLEAGKTKIHKVWITKKPVGKFDKNA